MITLIQTYGISVVLLILLVGIPTIVNFIKWCKNMWREREEFKKANIQKGREIECRAEKEEARLENGEARMTALEDTCKTLTDLAEKQQAMIELLIQSDELDIKSWIKTQHERWIQQGCIDSQTLELLEQRFAIYQKEGGNSWAEKLMNELRALPTVIVIPIKDIHDPHNQQK